MVYHQVYHSSLIHVNLILPFLLLLAYARHKCIQLTTKSPGVVPTTTAAPKPTPATIDEFAKNIEVIIDILKGNIDPIKEAEVHKIFANYLASNLAAIADPSVNVDGKLTEIFDQGQNSRVFYFSQPFQKLLLRT